MSAAGSPSEEETPAERLDRRERSVLHLLLHDPFPWSVAELERELDSQGHATDAIRSLAGSGLIHRLGDFVFPTRAARRADDLYQGAL
jgi:hypothetical protein